MVLPRLMLSTIWLFFSLIIFSVYLSTARSFFYWYPMGTGVDSVVTIIPHPQGTNQNNYYYAEGC